MFPAAFAQVLLLRAMAKAGYLPAPLSYVFVLLPYLTQAVCPRLNARNATRQCALFCFHSLDQSDSLLTGMHRYFVPHLCAMALSLFILDKFSH